MIDWNKVKSLKENGFSINQIMNEMSISRGSAQRILRNIKNGKTRDNSSNPTRIYIRLGISEKEYIDKLKFLYDSGMSQRKIADYFMINVATIENHFKKYNINARTFSEIGIMNANRCYLTSRQLEALDGITIADGHIESSNISGRLSYGCKFKETLFDIKKEFVQLHFSNPWFNKKESSWHFKSSYYLDLKSYNDRWYNNKIKIIPNDLKIIPKFCYWWFVGDGYVNKKCVILCTDGFGDKCLNKISLLFEKNGYESFITSRRRIRLSRKSTKKFMHNITSNVDISSQYQYKFDKEY